MKFETLLGYVAPFQRKTRRRMPILQKVENGIRLVRMISHR